MHVSSHFVAPRSDINASSRFCFQFLAVIASRHVTAARAIAAGVACSPYSTDLCSLTADPCFLPADLWPLTSDLCILLILTTFPSRYRGQ